MTREERDSEIKEAMRIKESRGVKGWESIPNSLKSEPDRSGRQVPRYKNLSELDGERQD